MTTHWFGELSPEELDELAEQRLQASRSHLFAHGEWEIALREHDTGERIRILELDDQMQLVDRLADRIDDRNLSALLSDWWSETEEPHRFGVDRVVEWFRRAGRIDHIPGLSWPTASVEIWRGTNRLEEFVGRGLSWSLDEEIAEKFAWRVMYPEMTQRDGWLWHARVQPDGILARLNHNHEQELVVDPNQLQGLIRVRSVVVPEYLRDS